MAQEILDRKIIKQTKTGHGKAGEDQRKRCGVVDLSIDWGKKKSTKRKRRGMAFPVRGVFHLGSGE
jgi:hypothetical protein